MKIPSFERLRQVVEKLDVCASTGLSTIGKPQYNEAPRNKLRGITKLNFEDFSETEANPVASLRGMSKFNDRSVRPEALEG